MGVKHDGMAVPLHGHCRVTCFSLSRVLFFDQMNDASRAGKFLEPSGIREKGRKTFPLHSHRIRNRLGLFRKSVLKVLPKNLIASVHSDGQITIPHRRFCSLKLGSENNRMYIMRFPTVILEGKHLPRLILLHKPPPSSQGLREISALMRKAYEMDAWCFDLPTTKHHQSFKELRALTEDEDLIGLPHIEAKEGASLSGIPLHRVEKKGERNDHEEPFPS